MKQKSYKKAEKTETAAPVLARPSTAVPLLWPASRAGLVHGLCSFPAPRAFLPRFSCFRPTLRPSSWNLFILLNTYKSKENK